VQADAPAAAVNPLPHPVTTPVIVQSPALEQHTTSGHGFGVHAVAPPGAPTVPPVQPKAGPRTVQAAVAEVQHATEGHTVVPHVNPVPVHDPLDAHGPYRATA
jgi:hypothetical protein